MCTPYIYITQFQIVCLTRTNTLKFTNNFIGKGIQESQDKKILFALKALCIKSLVRSMCRFCCLQMISSPLKRSKLWECEEYQTSLHDSGDMLNCQSHLITFRISLSHGVTGFLPCRCPAYMDRDTEVKHRQYMKTLDK